METITLVNGYDKRKTPEQITFRRFTIEDIKRLNEMHGSIWFESRQGTARECRRNGSLKTWKTDATRFECSFKYGLYENFRMNTQDMLNMLLIRID